VDTGIQAPLPALCVSFAAIKIYDFFEGETLVADLLEPGWVCRAEQETQALVHRRTLFFTASPSPAKWRKVLPMCPVQKRHLSIGSFINDCQNL